MRQARTASAHRPRNLPGGRAQPETRGVNFYRADRTLRRLLDIYVPDDERTHMEPRLERLGALVGERLDDLAEAADRNPPTLRQRDRQGRDRQSVHKHPAYVEMERLAFEELELAAMSHRPAFGWPRPLHPALKYALTYLFAQSEFGLLCPVNMTDSLTRTLRRFADPVLIERYLPRLLEYDIEDLYQGAMFMTEREAGSDVGAIATCAVREGDHWLLHGEKWFCSNADADLALVLARPQGAEPGIRGLGLFLMPRTLDDGEPNRYRIVRLKDKLGTRSMASGEIRLEGATAYLVGESGQGFTQMAEMINQSRLSNAVRSAGLMRRACHEALAVARGRVAFGRRLEAMPLMRRQLLKLLLPTRAALSMVFFTADALHRSDNGDPEAAQLVRVLTPLVKFRTCRDARKVAGDAMEVRGGCGYIEEWIEPRLLRDSHLGSIWEGSSNIVALDVLRASRKRACHMRLHDALDTRLDAARDLPRRLADALRRAVTGALALVDRAARDEAGERLARQASSGLYYATAAVVLATEGGRGEDTGDAGRLLLAHALLQERLEERGPLSEGSAELEAALFASLVEDEAVSPAIVNRICNAS